MKKPIFILFLFIAFLTVWTPSLSLYADTANVKAEKEKVYKKSDLLAAQDDTAEVAVLMLKGVDETDEIKTFDGKKVFSGNAENGVVIIATVYVPAKNGDWKELKTYSATVGASGIFSITADFNLGENFVVVNAEKDSKIVSQRAFTVKRKDSEIRDKMIEQPLFF